MVKVIYTSDGEKLVEGNKFAGSLGKGIKPPRSNTLVLDRETKEFFNVDVENIYSSVYTLFAKSKEKNKNLWSEKRYSSASDKADAYSNPKRISKIQLDSLHSYQVSVWGGLKPNVPLNKNESCFVHLGVYDYATPAVDPKTGEKGVVLSSGKSRVFYKDRDITSLEYSEKEDREDREENIESK